MGTPVGRHVRCLPQSLATAGASRLTQEGTHDGWNPDLEGLPGQPRPAAGRPPGAAGVVAGTGQDFGYGPLLNAQALLDGTAGAPDGAAPIEDDRWRMAARRAN